MTVSVIVTTYNRHRALERVLDGLAHQTRLPDDIIIADDGSDQRTRACIESARKKMACPIRHEWQPHEDFRAARIRNKAIKASANDYIIFLDGDCIPDKHFVADHCLLARPGFFTQGKRVLVSENLAPRFNQRFLDKNRLALLFCKGLDNKHHLLRLPWLPAISSRRLSGVKSCNLAMDKKDLYAVNGFNEAFSGWGREDSELVVRLFNHGLKRQDHAFAAICYHLWHPANPRHRIDHNDRLLAQAIASADPVCEHGLSRKP